MSKKQKKKTERIRITVNDFTFHSKIPVPTHEGLFVGDTVKMPCGNTPYLIGHIGGFLLIPLEGMCCTINEDFKLTRVKGVSSSRVLLSVGEGDCLLKRFTELLTIKK